jgi:hypothetical protein
MVANKKIRDPEIFSLKKYLLISTMIPFPSIGQLKDINRHITGRYRFRGSVKLHGTNAGIVSQNSSIWCQSRNRVLTQESDNCGFWCFIEEHKSIISKLLKCCKSINDIEPVAIYGEWCGKGIQTGTAINTLNNKIFVLFALKYGDQWFDVDIIRQSVIECRKDEIPIYVITEFPHWELDLIFPLEQKHVDNIISLTNQVEAECPVAKHFGIEGGGEGVVWECLDGVKSGDAKPLRFKVKGAKHSVVKNNIAATDPIKLNSIIEFVDYAVTENRMKQALHEEPHDVGRFLSWLNNDIIKEESDTMEQNGLIKKDVTKHINNLARSWRLKQIN